MNIEQYRIWFIAVLNLWELVWLICIMIPLQKERYEEFLIYPYIHNYLSGMSRQPRANPRIRQGIAPNFENFCWIADYNGMGQ